MFVSFVEVLMVEDKDDGVAIQSYSGREASVAFHDNEKGAD